MTLAEQIVDDLDRVFLNVDDFAESVIYYPKDKGSRTILAVISGRSRSSREDAYHLQQADQADLLVKNDPVTGMTEPQLGDAVRLPGDGPDQRWDFVQIVDRDPGGFTVRFGRRKLLRGGQKSPAGL